MAEPEEKLLEDYFQSIAVEAEEIPDVKLDTAIRKGLQHGNRKKISFRKAYGVVIVAVLTIALFIIVPWANQITNPVRAQLPLKSWGELEVYRPIIANNLTMTSALDAGIVKQTEVSSPEVDGLKLTINGVIADRRGIAVLYSLQNNTDQKVQILGLSMKRDPVDVYHLSGYSGFSTYNAEDVGSPGTTHMFEQIVWDKNQDELPKQLNITLSAIPVSNLSLVNADIKRTELSVELPIDADKDYFQGKVVDLKDSLTVSGQKIKMNKVYIGPTGIYMQDSYDGDNTMKIFRTLSPKLVMGKGNDQEDANWVSGVSLTNSGLQTNIYHNDNMRPDEPIKLEIEGINALDKSKVELVINTETQQILKAPDNNLTISKRLENEEQGILVLDFFIPKEDEEALGGSGFSLDDNFVDSAGSGHWLGRVKDDYSGYKEFHENSKGTTITYFFNVGKEKLPQPLTFKFNSYPSVIKEKASIRIK